MQKPDRTSNPMSFASILGPSNNEPSPPKPSEPKIEKKTSISSTPLPAPSQQENSLPQQANADLGITNGVNGTNIPVFDLIEPKPLPKPAPPPKPRKVLSRSEVERVSKELIKIDETPFSDTERGGFEEERQMYRERTKKRARQVEDVEAQKRKVRFAFCGQ